MARERRLGDIGGEVRLGAFRFLYDREDFVLLSYANESSKCVQCSSARSLFDHFYAANGFENPHPRRSCRSMIYYIELSFESNNLNLIIPMALFPTNQSISLYVSHLSL